MCKKVEDSLKMTYLNKLMKKLILFILSLVCIYDVTGCQNDSVSDAIINYGTSLVYSEEEMNEAIDVIKDQFNTGD